MPSMWNPANDPNEQTFENMKRLAGSPVQHPLVESCGQSPNFCDPYQASKGRRQQASMGRDSARSQRAEEMPRASSEQALPQHYEDSIPYLRRANESKFKSHREVVRAPVGTILRLGAKNAGGPTKQATTNEKSQYSTFGKGLQKMNSNHGSA